MKKSQVPFLSLSPFVRLDTFFYHLIIEPFVRNINSKKGIRFLEIGPGDSRIKDFETLNIVKNPITDYICDVSKKISFPDSTFDIVYTSHFLEHIEWFNTKKILNEIYRVLKKDGSVEIWVPDGLKIAQAFIDAEKNNTEDFHKDGWWRFNEEKDSTAWFNGRTFAYGDGTSDKSHFNWHKATFSERYLTKLLEQVGFKNIKKMDNSQCRGYDHGWINLGLRGEKSS